MAAYIENRWGLPQCIGAICGSHVSAPQEDHCDYFNRKWLALIILHSVVDGKGLFWSVSAGLSGSLHDALVSRQSTLWEPTSSGNHFPDYIRNIGGVNAGWGPIPCGSAPWHCSWEQNSRSATRKSAENGWCFKMFLVDWREGIPSWKEMTVKLVKSMTLKRMLEEEEEEDRDVYEGLRRYLRRQVDKFYDVIIQGI